MTKSTSAGAALFGLVALLLLASYRPAQTQTGTAPIRQPFQKQLNVANGETAFTIPAGRLLVIEYISAIGNNEGTGILTTVAYGHPASYEFDAFRVLGMQPSGAPYEVNSCNTAVKIYADQKTKVTVANMNNSVTSVSISGYLASAL